MSRMTVCPSVRQTIISNYTPVRAHLQRCIAFVINGNTGYDFPHPMDVARQHKSGRQDKRIIVVDNGKNLRGVKNVLISEGTVWLVELHVVTNLKDGEVYPDFLFTKKRVLHITRLGLQKLRNLFVNVLSNNLLTLGIQDLRDDVVVIYR